MRFSPNELYKVLESVSAQCGRASSSLVRLNVSDLTSKEISYYVCILNDAGMVEATRYQAEDYDRWYPVKLTQAGFEALEQTNKEFWESAEKAIVGAIDHWTGADISQCVEFLKSAVRKHITQNRRP